MKGISIEFYYKDDEIKMKDGNGRRLFLSSEFKEKSGTHIGDPRLKLKNANQLKNHGDINQSKIIDEDVFDENEENMALPKDDFAKYIINGSPPFDNFDFREFSKIFDVVKAITDQDGH
jgi:RNA-directed DNA polymerase